MARRPRGDVAAVTAVAAVGTSAGHELLATEADAAGAAVAALDEDVDLVDEHGWRSDGPGGAGRSGGLLGDAHERRSPLRSNRT